MDWIKVSAKTVEDAVTDACMELNVSRDNLEYRVVEEGSSGFLGLFGAKKAVIEAKVKKTDEELMKEWLGDAEQPAKKEPKKEAKREPRKEPRKDPREPSEGKEAAQEPEGKKEPKEPREPRKENRKAGRDGKKEPREPKKEPRQPREAAEAPEQRPDREAFERQGKEPSEKRETPREHTRSRRSRRQGPRNTEGRTEELLKNGGEGTAAAAEKPMNQGEPKEERAPRIPREPADPEEAKRRAESFLADVFRTMGMDVKIETSFEEEILSVNITGDEMGVLIGKRGQTLDSLQYLTSLVVNKGNAAYVRVKLDTEDYRNRRKATLENLARNIAQKVKKTRRPVFLEPMNPYERRIIHSALQNDPYVTTHSEGEEPCRKVVVTLRKGNERFEKAPRGESDPQE